MISTYMKDSVFVHQNIIRTLFINGGFDFINLWIFQLYIWNKNKEYKAKGKIFFFFRGLGLYPGGKNPIT